jgi:TetR/AcrR family transcriptional regulator
LFDELIARIRLDVDHGNARQERSRETRSRILDVALTIFSERGYDGASTRDIAEAAGVNQGLVTYYFGTKQMLWRAAVDKGLARYRNEFADRMASLNDPSDREFYRFALHHYVMWACENANVVRMQFSTDHAGKEQARWYTERHNRPFYDVWTSLIRHGQEQGIIRPGPLLNLYYFLASSATVFVAAQDVKLLSGVTVFDPDFVETHANLLYDMMIVAPAA